MRYFTVITALITCCVTSPVLAEKPNLIIFYADDLGWGETGVQGCQDIPTPNIDAIAAHGVRFPQAYVAATYCSPSRAGLLTGRYPTRFGHEFNNTARATGLHLNETSMATRLKTLGYATACIGKWHLGKSDPYQPTNRGFDEFYGTVANIPLTGPFSIVDSRISNEPQPVTDEDFDTSEAYTARAIDWLGKQDPQAPFFLYLPYNAVHVPLEAPQEYHERVPHISDPKRKVFAAMMIAMDDSIGKIMNHVREMGQEENTLVFFIGDNGGPTKSTTSSNGGLRGFKMNTYEGGPRVPFVAQWKGRWPAGTTYDFPVMNLDVLPTIIAAAGSPIDPEWKLDGVDLDPYLMGKNQSRPHETMYWRYGWQWAIRHGDLKLVVSEGGTRDPELYDIPQDPFESHDLAAAHPDKVRELQALWDKWSAEQAPPSAPDKHASTRPK